MNDKGKILVIDDEESLRFFLDKSLRGKGFAVTCTADGKAGLEALARDEFDLVLLDLKMPRTDGMQVLAEMGEQTTNLPVVMMTAFGDIKTAVQAMRLGAADFITKPFDSAEIGLVVAKALATRELKIENLRLRNLIYEREGLGAMVGKSAHMQTCFNLIERLASGENTVLIKGESGVGKKLAARELVARSPRANKPFLTLNPTALPPTMVEQELFGYLGGAFPGADQDLPGLCREADGGTLFIDNLAELPKPAQAKLMRLLEEGEVIPQGGKAPIKIDLRLLAATGPDLIDRMDDGDFREDLFYRLTAAEIEVPPLRRRTDDIPLLAEWFCKKHSLRLNQSTPDIPPAVIELFATYKWPGNVRELENTVERMLLMAPDNRLTIACLPVEIKAVSTPPPIQNPEKPLTFRTAMTSARRYYLEKLLEHTGGNVTRAAEVADISRPNLHRHIKECGIPMDDLRGKPK